MPAESLATVSVTGVFEGDFRSIRTPVTALSTVFVEPPTTMPRAASVLPKNARESLPLSSEAKAKLKEPASMIKRPAAPPVELARFSRKGVLPDPSMTIDALTPTRAALILS